jgi:hypothetical protein
MKRVLWFVAFILAFVAMVNFMTIDTSFAKNIIGKHKGWENGNATGNPNNGNNGNNSGRGNAGDKGKGHNDDDPGDHPGNGGGNNGGNNGDGSDDPTDANHGIDRESSEGCYGIILDSNCPRYRIDG